MLPESQRGPFEALLSGIFAASAGVTAKLGLDAESTDVVANVCGTVVASAAGVLERHTGSDFLHVVADGCAAKEVEANPTTLRLKLQHVCTYICM
jgi:hypothetical protein